MNSSDPGGHPAGWLRGFGLVRPFAALCILLAFLIVALVSINAFTDGVEAEPQADATPPAPNDRSMADGPEWGGAPQHADDDETPPATSDDDHADDIDDDAGRTPVPSPVTDGAPEELFRIVVPYIASEPPPTPTATPTPQPTPTATPVPPIDPGFLALEQRLTDMVASYWVPGQYAIAVTDIQTGYTIGVNLDQWQFSACVMNFYALLSVVRDIDIGVYSYTDEIDALIAETIHSSNASTAYQLYGITGRGDVLAGVNKVAAMFELYGIGGAVIDHPPLFGHISRGVNENNWVTARGVNEALMAFYNGEYLSRHWTDYLLARMTNVKPGLQYLTAYGNGGITSHKNGFFPYENGYVDNDAGIVRFDRNGQEYAYAISFYSMDVAEKYADLPLAQSMMQEVWAYFDARYP